MIKEIIKRTIFTPLPPHLTTTIVFFIHGGMGDRIVFQAIIKDFIARAPQRRIVAAIPFHADDYAAPNYVPKPDEVWVVSPIEDADLKRRLRLPMKVRRYADRKLFLPHKKNKAYYFGAQNDASSPHADANGIKIYEPYRYCREHLVPKNVFPEFPIDPEDLERMTGEFKAHHLEAGQDPIIAVHCRQRNDHIFKNPHLEDFVRAIDLLKEHLKAKIVLLGVNDIPDELTRRSSFLCPLDPSLKLAAATLSLCDLFIGGDSGPGHLAAAVGLPVISIQKKSRAGHWGPFCPSDHLFSVTESISSKQEEDDVRFDPHSVFALAKRSLEKSRRDASRSIPLGEKQERPPEKSFSWDRLLYIVDFLDHSNVKSISLLGPEPALQPNFIDFVLYLQKRGMRVKANTTGMIGENKIREMTGFFKETSPQEFSFRLDIDGRPELFRADKIRPLSDFLNHFSDRTTLSLKIHDPIFDLDRALFLIEQYSLPRKIRIDVTARNPRNIPSIIKKLRSYASFFKKNRIILDFDWCLPFCLFSGTELEFLYGVSQGNPRFGCRTSFDLTPDMKIRPCFQGGGKGLSERSIYDFNSLQDARDSFLKYSREIKNQVLCRTGRNKSCWNPCLAHLRRDTENETIIEISGPDVY